jgi:hypothetical protein
LVIDRLRTGWQHHSPARRLSAVSREVPEPARHADEVILNPGVDDIKEVSRLADIVL